MSAARALALGLPMSVLGAGWRWRPRRALDLAELRSSSASDGSRSAGAKGVLRLLGAVVEPFGRLVRQSFRRPADGPADRRAGAAMLAAVILVLTVPQLAVLVPGLWWAAPRFRRRRSAQSERAAIRADLPLVADLFVLVAGAGLTVPLAVAAVARRTTGPLGGALAEVERRTRLGQHPADALGGVIDAIGDAARPLVTVLVSAERYGTPLVAPLERIAEDVRRQWRREAEEAARRIPVKLLFPLVLCSLPAFALLTVVPLLLSALGHLQV